MASARDGTPIGVQKNCEGKTIISEFDPNESTAKKQEINLSQTPNKAICFNT